jgi:hypothetical protein
MITRLFDRNIIASEQGKGEQMNTEHNQPLVDCTVCTTYYEEQAGAALPNIEWDNRLKNLIGRDFDHAECEDGCRDVEWMCDTEEELARVVRILIENDFPWVIPEIFDEDKEVSAFQKRHGITEKVSLDELIESASKFVEDVRHRAAVFFIDKNGMRHELILDPERDVDEAIARAKEECGMVRYVFVTPQPPTSEKPDAFIFQGIENGKMVFAGIRKIEGGHLGPMMEIIDGPDMVAKETSTTH